MDVFTVLSEPRRRDILELLAVHGQLSSSDISKNFHVSKPAISQHLKVLREAKLVDMEKHAQQHLYCVNPSAMDEVEAWIRQMKREWNARLDRLEAVLTLESAKMREKGKQI